MTMKTTHTIKLNAEFCDAVLCGDKNFEIRENDRGYQKGDLIKFIPWNNGRRAIHPLSDKTYEITYVINGWELKNGYVVFGIKMVNE